MTGALLIAAIVLITLSAALTTVMAVSGAVALAPMGAHFVASVIVLRRARADELRWFHRVSIVVWSIWLVPFVAGAVSANIH